MTDLPWFDRSFAISCDNARQFTMNTNNAHCDYHIRAFGKLHWEVPQIMARLLKCGEKNTNRGIQQHSHLFFAWCSTWPSLVLQKIYTKMELKDWSLCKKNPETQTQFLYNRNIFKASWRQHSFRESIRSLITASTALKIKKSLLKKLICKISFQNSGRKVVKVQKQKPWTSSHILPSSSQGAHCSHTVNILLW